MASYAAPSRQCDVIMKGGITSGIVYPKAVLVLAENYRFRSIGGTSAGAIAAAITAAAELGRARGGFEHVEKIPAALRHGLVTLFQPAAGAEGLFRVFLAAVADGKRIKAGLLALASVWPATIIGFVIGAILGFGGDGVVSIVKALIVGIIVALVVGAGAFVVRALDALRRHDYGLCPGRSQGSASASPGFSDWIADQIEIAAGRMTAGGERPATPLTFKELWAGTDGTGSEDAPSINLKMMTTNLSMHQPSVLPNIGDLNYYFVPGELKAILPDWVVDHMAPEAQRHGSTEYFRFPKPGDLPVAVATRLSLSFPFLISAVPLYRIDYPGGRDRIERLLFSDGGISSNFPVHFFDALLPRRPTFGISLDDEDVHHPDRRVYLPMPPAKGQWVPIIRIGSIVDFFFSIIYTAKDWQDQLQSSLPGYRERIVHVYLKKDEGGFNVTMPAEKIDALIDFGRRAGELLVGRRNVEGDQSPFDLDDHKWRRFLVAFARLEETLGKTSEVWRKEGFRELVERAVATPPSYGESTREWRNDVFKRFDELMNCVAGWQERPLRHEAAAAIPKPETDIRITPKP